MKKYLTYRPDGIVIMVSNSKNKIAKHLNCKEFTINKTKEEQNWVRKVIKGKLVYEKSPSVEADEKAEAIEEIKKDITDSETTEDVKKLLNTILDLKL